MLLDKVLKPFLEGRHPGQYLFSPAESMAYHRAELRKKRKTKVQPSQVSRRRKNPKWVLRDHYSVRTYEQAIGIVANIAAESGGNPFSFTGDKGTAHGLAQWHADRRANAGSVAAVDRGAEPALDGGPAVRRPALDRQRFR